MTPAVRGGVQRGFTLFEILVAVAIFAVLGVAANRLLGSMVRSDEATRERGVRLAAVQRAIGVLERDGLQAVARPVRDELGSARPAMLGGLDVLLEFTRLGWRNPAGHPRAELQRVAYVLEGRQLLRLYWPVLDRGNGSVPVRQVLLDDVRSASVEFIDAEGQRLAYWPAEREGQGAAGGGALPRALYWRLEVPPYGEIDRLLPLPDNLPPRVAQGDEQGGGGDGAPRTGPIDGAAGGISAGTSSGGAAP